MENTITSDSVCQQGSVKLTQVLCNEMPFFVNNNGDIAYRDPHNVIIDVDYGRKSLAEKIVVGLNEAYKLGFEYERFEWK